MQSLATDRSNALEIVARAYESGAFLEDLARLVAIRTISGNDDAIDTLRAYLDEGIGPKLKAIGFTLTIYPNPEQGGAPLLLASRHEDDAKPTILIYGHGDVVPGMEDQWTASQSPWLLESHGDKLFGRGTADNKGQHLVNIAALEAVIEARGELGFNCKVLIEMGEEIGSRGLAEICERYRDELAADLLIASDGPRLQADTPTVFLGARGTAVFRLDVELRERAYHSGNWGGLISDPGIRLGHAIASITDSRGVILVPGWRPMKPDARTRALIADCPVTETTGNGVVDEHWGEPELTPAERLIGWNSFNLLALDLGDPQKPIGAIQPRASAVCQLRFVVGTQPDSILPELRAHLDAEGFKDVRITPLHDVIAPATRASAEHPAVGFCCASIEATTGKKVHLLPNLGGTLPNHVFADILDLPTIWIPHSYRGCSQHAANEHNLGSILSEGLAIMTGLFWDLGLTGNATWSQPALTADTERTGELYREESIMAPSAQCEPLDR